MRASPPNSSVPRAEHRTAGAWPRRPRSWSAALLTSDPVRRAQRVLATARTKRDAGALDEALGLLVMAEAGPLDTLQSAEVERLRGQIASDQRRGIDAVRLLLRAARLPSRRASPAAWPARQSTAGAPLASCLYIWRIRARPSPDDNRRDAAADERDMEERYRDHLAEHILPDTVPGHRRADGPVRSRRGPPRAGPAAQPVAGEPVRVRAGVVVARRARPSGGDRPAGVRSFAALRCAAVPAGDERLRSPRCRRLRARASACHRPR